MIPKLLFVDDDPALLAAIEINIRQRFAYDVTPLGSDALHLIQTRGPYAAVVAHRTVPGLDGVDLLARVGEVSPETVRIMLSSDANQQTAVDAVNRGRVFCFLHKPCSPELLVATMERAVEQYRQSCGRRELLEQTLAGSVKILVDVMGMIVPEELGRGQRLHDSMGEFSRRLGIGRVRDLEVAALLSPLGYATVPLSVLRKRSTGTELQPAEKAVVRRAPQFGYDLISDVPCFKEIARIVLYQHKHFDSSGFPDDTVGGRQIPQGARMLKILLDRLDLENDGVVRRQALQLMKARGGVYDLELLEQCFSHLPDFLPNPISKDRPVVRRAAAQLLPGEVVVSDVTTHAGLKLLASGNRLTAMTIRRLAGFAEIGDLQEPLLVQEAG